MLDLIMGTASRVRGVSAHRQRGEAAEWPGDLSKDVNGIPGDVAFMAYACARCGYCVPTCEQYSGRGWESQSPRGKYAYLREVMAGREKWDRKAIDTMLVCTTCEVCNTRCQLQLPIEHNWMAMRGKLINEEKRGTFPPFEMMAASLRGEKRHLGRKAENRDAWVPEDVAAKIKDEVRHPLLRGMHRKLRRDRHRRGADPPAPRRRATVAYMGKDEACCGIPMKVAGKWDLFEEIYEHNVTEARKRGAKTIVTSCPACALVWKELYANLAAERGEEYEFEVKHYSELIAPALADGTTGAQETHSTAASPSTTPATWAARKASTSRRATCSRRFPGRLRRDGAQPRGGPVLRFGPHARRRDEVAPVLGGHRLQEAVDAGADTVVALCPCCQVQLRDSNIKNDLGLKIDDLLASSPRRRAMTSPRPPSTRCTCGASSTSSSS